MSLTLPLIKCFKCKTKGKKRDFLDRTKDLTSFSFERLAPLTTLPNKLCKGNTWFHMCLNYIISFSKKLLDVSPWNKLNSFLFLGAKLQNNRIENLCSSYTCFVLCKEKETLWLSDNVIIPVWIKGLRRCLSTQIFRSYQHLFSTNLSLSDVITRRDSDLFNKIISDTSHVSYNLLPPNIIGSFFDFVLTKNWSIQKGPL